MTKRKLILVISLLAIAIMIGGSVMHLYNKHKQEELKRNREYEISLVKALKNSYEGIEEIEISNPDYTSPPGDWSCDIKIEFLDKTNVNYRIGHNLNNIQNYNGSRRSRSEWDYLNSHKGTTTTKIQVRYSNGEKEEK